MAVGARNSLLEVFFNESAICEKVESLDFYPDNATTGRYLNFGHILFGQSSH